MYLGVHMRVSKLQCTIATLDLALNDIDARKAFMHRTQVQPFPIVDFISVDAHVFSCVYQLTPSRWYKAMCV